MRENNDHNSGRSKGKNEGSELKNPPVVGNSGGFQLKWCFRGLFVEQPRWFRFLIICYIMARTVRNRFGSQKVAIWYNLLASILPYFTCCPNYRYTFSKFVVSTPFLSIYCWTIFCLLEYHACQITVTTGITTP
jgi:hypothetical protein